MQRCEASKTSTAAGAHVPANVLADVGANVLANICPRGMAAGPQGRTTDCLRQTLNCPDL